ncbi:hypothetical protein B0H13DRAFT_2322913 [Mycena leptocephala]|nr:hypothetical protein B0H13DRAFT_2322913 [Mycena leptocephala]
MAAMAGEKRFKRWRCRPVTYQVGPADPASSHPPSSSHRRLHRMRALPWTPESMPDQWVEFEGASSLSSFKCEPRVVIGGWKEARVRARTLAFGVGVGRDYVPRAHSSTPLHGVCFTVELVNRIYPGFFFLSPALPPQAAVASSHPRCPTYSIRLSSLPCVLRPRRPHAHCFYCTRARLPLALPDYLSTSGASPFPSPRPWTRFALVHEVPPVLLHSCAVRSSRCAGTHAVARCLDLAPLSLRMRSALYASCPPPVESLSISILSSYSGGLILCGTRLLHPIRVLIRSRSRLSLRSMLLHPPRGVLTRRTLSPPDLARLLGVPSVG